MPSGNRVLGFGVFELDLRAGELRKRGTRVKLQGKPLLLLGLLAEHSGSIVSHDELRRLLWSADTFVDFQHSVGVAVWKLRQALSDTAATPRFIETIPRRGYRFIAPVRDLSASATQGKRMLAVLPFENLSRGAEYDYLAEGLTEEMITQLGRLDPQRLGVIARASSMHYRGTTKRLPEIGQELGVQFVLMGSLRRGPKRLRVSTQLIRVADQVQQWAESYDLPLKGMLRLQVRAAEQIAKALELELLPQQRTLIARSQARNVEAYEFYLQGRYHWNRRTDESALTAIHYFQRAAQADPGHALSFAGLADSYAVLTYYGNLPPREGYGQAKTYALRALSLDPSLAEAHSSLAFCLLQYDWDWESAERAHLEAIALNPNSAPPHHWYGLDLTQVGRFSEALVSLQHALAFDPFSVPLQAHIGRLAYFARDYSRAIRQLERAVELDRTYLPARYFLALARLLFGQEEPAIADLRRLVLESREHPILISGLAFALGRTGAAAPAQELIARLRQMADAGARVPPFFIAFALAGLPDKPPVFSLLEDAFVERFGWLLYLAIEPAFDPFRDDAPFQDLLSRLNVFRRAAGA